jgi:hypothetical protein
MSKLVPEVRQLRRLTDRLTYANVVATLALFVALGGVSYAAVELPARSVGRRQLRRGAVTPEALGFPLGARLFSPPSPFLVPPIPTCSDLPPSDRACYVVLKENLLLGHLHLRAPAQVALNALLRLENNGPAVTVKIELFESASPVTTNFVNVGAQETVEVPLQTLDLAKAGIHSIGLGAWALHGGSERVWLRGGSVIATAFPQASAPGASKCTGAEPLLC